MFVYSPNTAGFRVHYLSLNLGEEPEQTCE